MKFRSPLSLAECRAILSEQIAKRRLMALFHPLTSTVVGVVKVEEVILESAVDRFSKRFIGRLSDLQGQTILQGEWSVSFWSKVWGDHRFDEEEIIRFLSEYAQLTPEPNQAIVPTPMSVTPAADAPVAPDTGAADL